MSEHTPGKLVVRGGYSIYADGGTMPIADACVTTSKRTNDEANARRLVAAWNACEHLATDTLEVLGNVTDAIGAEFDKIKAERDSLRAVNVELLEALRTARDHIDMDALEVSHRKDADQIRAAIASARKQGEQG